jgi:hypothetical protein
LPLKSLPTPRTLPGAGTHQVEAKCPPVGHFPWPSFLHQLRRRAHLNNPPMALAFTIMEIEAAGKAEGTKGQLAGSELGERGKRKKGLSGRSRKKQPDKGAPHPQRECRLSHARDSPQEAGVDPKACRRGGDVCRLDLYQSAAASQRSIPGCINPSARPFFHCSSSSLVKT